MPIAMVCNGIESWVNVDLIWLIRKRVTLKRPQCADGQKRVIMIFHGFEEMDGIHMKNLNLARNMIIRCAMNFSRYTGNARSFLLLKVSLFLIITQIGKPLEGHYMVAEATNSRSTQKSRLLSPIHPKADSENACFRFFYHMYGAGVGQLRVIVKPIDENINDIADNQR